MKKSETMSDRTIPEYSGYIFQGTVQAKSEDDLMNLDSVNIYDRIRCLKEIMFQKVELIFSTGRIGDPYLNPGGIAGEKAMRSHCSRNIISYQRGFNPRFRIHERCLT